MLGQFIYVTVLLIIIKKSILLKDNALGSGEIELNRMKRLDLTNSGLTVEIIPYRKNTETNV